MFEVSLGDLHNEEEHAYRKIRLRAEDVQGKNVLTNFWVRLMGYILLAFTIFHFVNVSGVMLTNFSVSFELFRAWISLQTS